MVWLLTVWFLIIVTLTLADGAKFEGNKRMHVCAPNRSTGTEISVLSAAHPGDQIKLEDGPGSTPLTFSPPSGPLDTPCTALFVIMLSSWHATFPYE